MKRGTVISIAFSQLEDQTGWNDNSKVVLLAQFIHRQGLEKQAVAYLHQQAEEEEQMCSEDEDDEDEDDEDD